jgi:hypothetical protein
MAINERLKQEMWHWLRQQLSNFMNVGQMAARVSKTFDLIMYELSKLLTNKKII